MINPISVSFNQNSYKKKRPCLVSDSHFDKGNKADSYSNQRLSSAYNYAAFVSFGKNKHQINIDSKNYSLKDYYPEYKKVPNGFKYIGTKKLYAAESITKKGTLGSFYNPELEQVTIIDRSKDRGLKIIKNDFSNEIAKWQTELHDCKGFTKDENDEFIILKTLDYIRDLKYSKSIDWRGVEKNPSKELEGKESYLGEVFAAGKNVCRHNAFLSKILLEDHNVALGVQSGYIISPYGSGHHCWNTHKEKDGLVIPYDASFPDNDCWYFSYGGEPLYVENLTKQKQSLFDVLSMQIGDEILLGFDEEGDVVTNKTDENAKYFARLKLEESDQMYISSITPDEDSPYDYTLDEKNNVLFYDKENNQTVFEFPFSNLTFFLKVRMSADCIKLSKMLNIPMPNGKINYEAILKNKDLIKTIDPTINQEMIDSLPELLGIS